MHDVGLGAQIAELSCSVTSALDTLVEYYKGSGRASVANPHLTVPRQRLAYETPLG